MKQIAKILFLIIASFFFPVKGYTEYLEFEEIADTIYYNFMVNPYNPTQLVKLGNNFIQVSNDYGNSFTPIRAIWENTPTWGWGDPIYITGENGDYILQYILTDTLLYQYTLDGGQSWIGYKTLKPDPRKYRLPNDYSNEIYTRLRRAVITTKPYIRALSVHLNDGLLIHDLISDTIVDFIPFHHSSYGVFPLLYVYPSYDKETELVLLISPSGLYDECNIWWSTDAGDTWQRPEQDPLKLYDLENIEIADAAINPLNPRELMVLANLTHVNADTEMVYQSDILYSSDRGETWTIVNSLPLRIYGVISGYSRAYITPIITEDLDVNWIYKLVDERDRILYPDGLLYTQSSDLEFKPLPTLFPNPDIKEIRFWCDFRYSPVLTNIFYAQGYPINYVTQSWENFANFKVTLKPDEIGINPSQNHTLSAVWCRNSVVFTMQSLQVKELQIIGLNGSIVRTLDVKESQTSIPWLGTDNNGNQLPSGIYFARAEDEHGNVATTKVVLVR